MTDLTNPSRRFPRHAFLTGAIVGAAYGILARMALSNSAIREWVTPAFGVMTYAFLFAVPFAIGVLTVRTAARPSIAYRLFGPWAPVLLAVGISYLVGWEGAICIVLGLPVLLVMASLGGLSAGWFRGRRPATILPFAPLALGAVESRVTPPTDLRRVETVVVIAAPVDTVWANVVSVRPIEVAERRPALYTAIGFPAPVSATLPDTGVGAVREARFAGGVAFRETVTAWERHRRLAFTVHAQTEVIPPSTLDPHVTIGGPYFDVLTGAYALEPLPNDRVRLTLTSTFRLTTRFNYYAGLWTDAVMRSIQRNILAVIQARCEGVARSASAADASAAASNSRSLSRN